MNTDKNRMFETRMGRVFESLKDAVDKMIPAVTARIQGALKTEGERAHTISVLEYPSNSIDGTIKVGASCLRATGSFSFSVPVQIIGGKPAVSEVTILTAFLEAKNADTATPAKLTQSPIASMDVDLLKISAERHGELVVYSHPNLPDWSYFVPTSTLSAENNRALIASRIVASVRGFCLSDFRLVAKLLQTSFSLPMVHEINVTAAVVPAAEIPGFSVPKTEHAIEAEVDERNLLVHGGRASEAPAFFYSEDDRRHQTETRIRAAVTPAVGAYVKQTLKGSQPKVLEFDYSKSRVKTAGTLSGEVTCQVRFYGNMSIEDTSLVVSFDDKGKVVADKIKKSALAIKAEAQREADLKILSEEEAGRQLDAYRKKMQADAALAVEAGLHVEAGSAGSLGSNFFNSPAAARVPMLKALLPADVKAGDKINVRGYVYEISATDYNSPDVEHSAFWMLNLTQEIPTEKIPNIGVWG